MQSVIDGYQGVFQTADEIQTQDHIFRNRPFPHDFLMILSQMIFIIIAYKDPVENQHMKKILDRFVTGFFVVTLGILWYFSSKYQVRQERYRIIIYDVFGKIAKIDGVRTDFRTYRVATNYISEYQDRFPHYNFSMAAEIPEIKRRPLLRIFKKNQI